MKKYKSKKSSLNVIKFIEITVLTVLVVSFLVLVYCIYVSVNSGNISLGSDYETEKLSTDIDPNLTENVKEVNEKSISDMVDDINNSIVGISKIKNKGSTIFLQDGAQSLNLGTGFIISEDGYILTNEHVSGDKHSTCYVTLNTGNTFTADVIWADKDLDFSVLKINGTKFTYLELGDSDKLKIAQTVYAIGNPVGFEFQRTVTCGIISGLERTIKIEEEDKTYYMEDLIQTDATINPGNSGGPLVDSNGKVIGINSVKITTAEGIGFAIPINIVKPIIENIKNNGDYKTASIGVFAYDKNVIPYINQDLGINQKLDTGIYVAEVVSNSAAEKAGINPGDILLSIDNQELNKMSDLRKYIYTKQPEDVVKIKYLRNDRQFETDVVLLHKKTGIISIQ